MASCALIALVAAVPVLAERQFFRPYGQQEGLLNPRVRMMTQDPLGFFWLATAHGAYRFDGTQFEYMHGRGLTEIDTRWIHCAADGGIWVHTPSRVVRWQDGKASLVMSTEPQAASGDAARQTIGSDRRGDIWVVSSPTRLERLRAGNWRREMIREESAGLWSVLPLADGSVLAGCGDGLCTWREGRWETLLAPRERYLSLYEARDGAIYARGVTRIARRRSGEPGFTDITRGLPPISEDQQLPQLTVDFHRRPITSTEQGVARLEGESWQVISNDQGLADQVVRSVFVGREGSIWIGTTNGLHRWLGDGAWRHLGTAEGLPRRGLDTAAQDRSGAVWITSKQAGVFRGESRQGQWRFRNVEGLPPARVVLPLWRDGSVWFGLQKGGLWRYEPATRRLARVPGVDSSVRVHDFSIDRQGRVLVVGDRGFYRERSPGVLAPVVEGKEFFAISEDKDGALWLGGFDSIIRVRGDEVTTILSDDGVEKRSVRALHAAADGHIWTGTWKLDGLREYRLENGRLRSVGTADNPLQNVNTFFIRRDWRNRIWTGTVRGAAYLEDGRWHHFSQATGLVADQCTYACFLRDGSVWLATAGGLALYTPPVDAAPVEPPAVVLKSVAARFGLLPLTGRVEIPALESDLGVDYSVLSASLDAPANVRYRLHETDGWRSVRQRPLEFPNLSPGEYRLELAAQGRAGTWATVPATYSFRVLPFWWQTWWFRAALAGGVAALTGLLWRLRTRKTQRLHFERLLELVDEYPGVVFVLSPEGRFVLANRQLEEHTRQPRGGLIGRRPSDAMSPKNAANFERNLATVLAQEKPLQYREEYEVPSGTVVFDVRAFPLRGARGEVESVCCFATDVTDRWRLEQEKAQAAERYESFVRQSTEAIWRVEFEPPVPLELPALEFRDTCYQRGFIREANTAGAEFLGVPLDSLIGKRYIDIRDPHLPANRRSDYRWYRNGFQSKNWLSVVVDAQGQTRTLLANSMGVVEKGCLVRSWATQRDITEQRQLELERGQATERYESFVKHSTEGIWRIEFEPPIPIDLPIAEFGTACYTRGIIREANAAAASFFALPLEQVLGSRYEQLVDRGNPANRASDAQWYRNGFQSNDRVSVITNTRGEQRILLSNSKGVVENGCLTRSWVTQRDVTEQRLLEQERIRANERYQSFVKNSTEAIWLLEIEPPIPVDLPPGQFGRDFYAQAVVREANAAAASLLGLPLEQLLGRRYEELADRRIQVNREMDRLWYENGFQMQDKVLIATDAHGEQRILLANAQAIVEDGRLVRVWATHRDVTDQRRLEDLITNTARGVSAETGVQFFDSLVQQLASSLGASQTLALELLPGGRGLARVLAGWGSPDIVTGSELEVAGTPAESALVTGKAQTYGLPEALEASVPSELNECIGGSCMVTPLIAATGGVTGCLVVNWDRPSDLSARARAVVDIFTARAAAELDRLRIEREVLSYQGQLKALSIRNQHLAEKERAHLAREIHDELGQHLTAIKIGLSTIRKRVEKGATERAVEEIGELMTLTEETVGTVRRLATELRPPALDQLGLAAAIRWQAKEMQQRLGIPIECRLEEVPLDRDVATTAFRILQESLTNVMRHAQAGRVDVRLQRRDGSLVLTVQDDGNGFTPSPGGGGRLGLLGMHERVAAVGGQLTIQSHPGQGTVVEAILPALPGKVDYTGSTL